MRKYLIKSNDEKVKNSIIDCNIKIIEILKEKLGIDFVNKLGEDSSLIEIMYE